MRIDRLLEIVIYLLNHEAATASQLAARFEVSVRTIQRDMDAIAAAGIPIYALTGASGGYRIIPDYKVHNQFVKKEDFQYIVMALKSLSSSYSNARLEKVLEKYLSTSPDIREQRVFWDFGVAKENRAVQEYLGLIENCISQKHLIIFDYTTGNGYSSEKQAEPLALQYKWYAWYLFAYDVKKKDYRTYKVARMKNVSDTGNISVIIHDDIERLMHEREQDYYSTCEEIWLITSKDKLPMLEEYFPDIHVEDNQDGSVKAMFCMPPGERLWKALLLSMGNTVTVLSPEHYKNELIETARKFVENYDI